MIFRETVNMMPLAGRVYHCVTFLLLALVSVVVFQQPIHAQAGSQPFVLTLLNTAFSGGNPVQHVQLTGSATWYAGSLEDAGTVNLTASTDGSSSMQLVLSTSGQRTETTTGIGTSANCQWAGNDGVAHAVSSGNCWRPALWFLPAMWLQSQTLASNLSISDLGTGSVGSGENSYRHLQGQFSFSDLPDAVANDLTLQSIADIGLDSTTMLPTVMTYAVMPDGGAATPVSVEIDYSDYRMVNGAQVPFSIKRFVNGSLQLAITVTSAQIN
jgi:hypothetical protein